MTAKTAPEVEQRVLVFLGLGWPTGKIIKSLKDQGIIINRMTISRIKKRKENPTENKQKTSKKPKTGVLSERQISELKKMVENPNPPTQKSMAKKFGVTQQAISKRINKNFNKKIVRKPKGQALSAAAIKKRYQRSWPLYARLKCDQWKKVITTDEAWFYLVNIERKTKIQYISRFQNRSVCETFIRETHLKGIMVWLGISSNGSTKARFISPGAKINTNFYINKVLKPFIREDIPKLYPNGDYLFQQDSAPSHRAKKTQDFLRNNQIPFITEEEWLPNSSDCAPLDYFYWSYLKHKVNQRKPRTISGLKKVIREEVQKVPQTLVNKALKSWPKRCRLIFYNKGLHIEKDN